MLTPTKRKKSSAITQLAAQFEHIHGLVNVRVFQHMAVEVQEGDLSFSQFNTIYLIYQHGEQNVTGIANGARLSHAAASHLVDRLLKLGLVERKENPEDRRQKLITLTPAGVARLNSFKKVITDGYLELLHGFSASDLAVLIEAIGQINSKLPPHPLSHSKGA